jgi:hypothetical protein
LVPINGVTEAGEELDGEAAYMYQLDSWLYIGKQAYSF